MQRPWTMHYTVCILHRTVTVHDARDGAPSILYHIQTASVCITQHTLYISYDVPATLSLSTLRCMYMHIYVDQYAVAVRCHRIATRWCAAVRVWTMRSRARWATQYSMRCMRCVLHCIVCVAVCGARFMLDSTAYRCSHAMQYMLCAICFAFELGGVVRRC